MSPKTETKYRPYLSLPEIEYLLNLIQSDGEKGLSLAISIHKSLKQLQLKAAVGIASGSYQTKPRATFTDKLGFGYEDETERRYLAGEMSPEEESKYLENLMKGEST